MLQRLFVFFFLSGFSALIYEVAWVRELALILGNTAQATSVVLAVFMGGLALGAYLGGRYADKSSHEPLAIYGSLELSISVVALLISKALMSADLLYLWMLHSLGMGDSGIVVVRLIMAIGLLLIPTMLMGATLPVLVKYLERYQLPSRMFSLLYGLNTLGATAGSMFACFVGFAYIGIQGTLNFAAAINMGVGLLSLVMSRKATAPNDSSEASAEGEPEAKMLAASGQAVAPVKSVDPVQFADPVQSVDPVQAVEPAPTRSPSHSVEMSFQILCSISFLTGFTALSYEVLWTRILRSYLTSLTYSFTIMVSMFLLGLAIGSFIYERFLAKNIAKTQNQYLNFAAFQYLAALACACSLPFFPYCSREAKLLISFAAQSISALHSALLQQLCYMALVSIPTILCPAILIGVLFPMIGTLASSRNKGGSTAVGTVYAFNTIGCVFGSLVCGLFLMPYIGSTTTFQWIVVASTITGALALLFAPNLALPKRLLVTVLPLAFSAYFLSLHFRSNIPHDAVLLAEGEDTTGIMRILDLPKSDGTMLELNGSSLACTTPANRRYMRLLAHLPMLLHKDPEKVLLGCFGTGTTAGAVSLYPELKQFDVVDLSKMVLDSAPYFSKTNYDVLKNPKVSVHVNDVRTFLLSTDNSYDVITFEPPPPTYAGIVSLYTEEFYQLVDKRLNQNGLMCQWIPMHSQSAELWKMMIASARSVFPYVSIWIPNTEEALLLASKEPVNADFARMEERIEASPKLKESLADAGFDNAMSIMSTFVMAGKTLDDFLKNSLSISDNYPRLEFYLPYAGARYPQLYPETVGRPSLLEFVQANKNAKGFDEKEFAKNWQANHLLRMVQETPLNDHAEADKLIDEAHNLLPENRWFTHVFKRRQVVYPSPAPNFSN